MTKIMIVKKSFLNNNLLLDDRHQGKLSVHPFVFKTIEFCKGRRNGFISVALLLWGEFKLHLEQLLEQKPSVNHS